MDGDKGNGQGVMISQPLNEVCFIGSPKSGSVDMVENMHHTPYCQPLNNEELNDGYCNIL